MSESSAEMSAGAIKVLQAFLDASLRKDEQAMKACLTRKTLESGQMNSDGPEGVKYILGDAQIEGDKVIIPMKAVPIEAEEGAPAAMEMACVMVKEQGEWKFDLATTMERLMGGGLGAAMEQIASKMTEAMQGVGEALSSGMQAVFGHSSDGDRNWSEASLDVGEDEFLPKPEMTRLPKTEAAISLAVGSAVLVQAAMPDLLGTLHSDDSAGLITWFEDTLFASLGEIIAQSAARMPLSYRLRAVRIEAAKWSDDRFIALDGSDLVYRMFLNNTEGYYSDDALAEILPGVLAGLPEKIDPRVAGRRLLANDEEDPPVEIYRERVVPRFMRRISELLGRNIRLEANWDDVSDTRTMTRQLSRWGLNRVYGAIALACLDETLRESLKSGLTTVRLAFGNNLGDRFAHYRDGTLEVGLSWYHGEKCCLYEHDIARVLGGDSIQYEEEAETAEKPEDEHEAEADTEDADAGDQAAGTEAAAAGSQNTELFDSAVKSLREVEPMWRQQLEMALGHATEFEVDYDSLGGQFEQVQPFVHQAISGALAAITQIGFNPATQGPLRERVHGVVVRAGEDGARCAAELDDGTLTIRAPLAGDGPPPTEAIAGAIKALLDAQATTKPDKRQPAQAADPYARANQYMQELEAAMRADGMWPSTPPPKPLVVKGAFGCENMAFTQWLAWVLIPRVREIVADKGRFPAGSAVAAYAVRELDGVSEAGEVIKILIAFDKMVDGLNQ